MAEMEMPSVGFVGLGNMGGAIAERLARSGMHLHVCDTRPDALARLVGCGAKAHATPRSVADAASIVFGCLPTVKASHAVAHGADGLCDGRMIRHYVEMATVGSRAVVEIATVLAKCGVTTLDAPVSGGAAAALRGELTIMTGGPADVLDAVRPVLLAITPTVIPIGSRVGDGQTMKLVNNLLAAANMATAFEALVVGVRLGLAPSVMSRCHLAQQWRLKRFHSTTDRRDPEPSVRQRWPHRIARQGHRIGVPNRHEQLVSTQLA